MLPPRIALWCAVIGLMIGPIGCCGMGQRNALRQSQHRAMQLYQQNQSLAAQGSMSAGQLAAERDALRQQLGTMQQRLDNLQNERGELMQRYDSLVNSTKQSPSPLSENAANQLADLSQKYPGFEFDPRTGVSKFHSDLLFELGSSDVRPEGMNLLKDFAQIITQPDSQPLNILVVGHTDDTRVVRASTKAKHTDNWGLSTNRANEVVRALGKNGVADQRMGAAGYGPHQPIAANTDAASRQRNRRVEIFVLAPNAAVAGWEFNKHQ